jgi:hypothetical protein
MIHRLDNHGCAERYSWHMALLLEAIAKAYVIAADDL